MQIKLLLKEIRKQKDLTLQELSDLTKISTTHLNDIENNLKEPSLSIAIKLSIALNVKIEELYEITDEHL